MPTSFTGMMMFAFIIAMLAFAAIALLRRSPLPDAVGEDDKCPLGSALSELWDERDAEFVASCGGPEMLARFQSHRRAVLRAYLNELSREFRRTSTALKLHLAEADSDRAELVQLLVRETWRFQTAMAWQRLCLALYWTGLKPGLPWPELSLARVRRWNQQPVEG
jgi:hypothetical protein